MDDEKYVRLFDVLCALKNSRLYKRTSDGEYTKGSYDTVAEATKQIEKLNLYTASEIFVKSIKDYVDRKVTDIYRNVNEE